MGEVIQFPQTIGQKLSQLGLVVTNEYTVMVEVNPSLMWAVLNVLDDMSAHMTTDDNAVAAQFEDWVFEQFDFDAG
jgi:hypothetical protein